MEYTQKEKNMKLYIFTEEALQKAIRLSMEKIDETLGLCNLCESPTINSIVGDVFIESAEKSGHIIERQPDSEHFDILGVLQRCFPRAGKNPIVNEAAGA